MKVKDLLIALGDMTEDMEVVIDMSRDGITSFSTANVRITSDTRNLNKASVTKKFVLAVG